MKVAIVNHNGQVGKPIVSAMVALASSRTDLELVVLHRASSDTSGLPKTIETREVDFVNVDAGKLAATVSDLDIVISAVTSQVATSQIPLIDALKSSKQLHTFFISDYGTPWTAEDLAWEGMGFLKEKEKVYEHAKAAGIPVTRLQTGPFEHFAIPMPLVGINIKENKLHIPEKAMTGKLPLTTVDYIGASVAHLIANRYDDLPNKTFTAVNKWITGQQLAEQLEAFYGKAPEITYYTQEEGKADHAKGPFPAIGAVTRRNWAFGFPWNGEILDFETDKKGSIEGLVSKYATK